MSDYPPYGMTSEDLAHAVGDTVSLAVERVLGTGKEQYDLGDHQQFEDLAPGELAKWLREELSDLIVYAVMLDIRVQRLTEGIEKLGAEPDQNDTQQHTGPLDSSKLTITGAPPWMVITGDSK